MSLRERNAARTRELILDTALSLFLEQGYDATRMEEVAARAEVGTSTLYRYFPTKDLLVLEPLAIRGQMAAELRSRPPEEPLDVALGHAVVALLVAPRTDEERLARVDTVIDRTPSLRGRLLEEFVRERTLLEEAVAERLDRPADDVFCVVTARLATLVLELVADAGRRSRGGSPMTRDQVLALARQVMDRLQDEPPVAPRA